MKLKAYKKKLPDSNFKLIGLVFNITLEFVAGVIVGLLIGYYLDKTFNTKPVFIIIFLCLGFFAGMLNTYRYIKRFL